MNIQNEYDVIVVGGGHAGCEAASAAANMGSSVLLINADLFSFARMSCNPAVGGIAKGQIVRQVSAYFSAEQVLRTKWRFLHQIQKSQAPGGLGCSV